MNEWFFQRIKDVSENPDCITPKELLDSNFLDKVFWKKFGSGQHLMMCGHYEVTKHLYNGTYKSNSGKSRMGSWTPYFNVLNTRTGKKRQVGMDDVRFHVEMKKEFGTNRRNDPERNWGLPE